MACASSDDERIGLQILVPAIFADIYGSKDVSSTSDETQKRERLKLVSLPENVKGAGKHKMHQNND